MCKRFLEMLGLIVQPLTPEEEEAAGIVPARLRNDPEVLERLERMTPPGVKISLMEAEAKNRASRNTIPDEDGVVRKR